MQVVAAPMVVEELADGTRVFVVAVDAVGVVAAVVKSSFEEACSWLQLAEDKRFS